MTRSSLVFLMISFSATIAASFRLSCKRADGEDYKSKKYLPNLITVSRINSSLSYVDLRCQGMTLEGELIVNDSYDVKFEVNNSSLTTEWGKQGSLEDYDAFYARFISMSCGNAGKKKDK